MRKGLRKLSSMVLAVFLVITMVSPSFAVNTIKIKVNDPGGGNYKFYKLLDAKKGTGDNYSYTAINTNYKDSLRTSLDLGADPTVAQVLHALREKQKTDELRIPFVEGLYAKIKANPTATLANANLATGVDLDRGYYLIVEEKVGSQADPISFLLVQTLDNGGTDMTITPKEVGENPVLKKFVEKSEGDSNWVGETDYQHNKTMKFRLSAKIPTNFTAHKKYHLIFHDMVKENVFTLPTSINNFKIFIADDENGTSNPKPSIDKSGGDFTFESTTNDEAFTDHTGTKGFTVKTELNKLLKDGKIQTTDAGKYMILEYSMTFGTAAKSGHEGNLNHALLEYSHDANSDGVGDLGKTPPSVVKVFMYKLVITKKGEDGAALNGAKFKLESTTTGYSKEIDGNATNIFTFEGLDSGVAYTLTETETPTSYNTMDSITFTINSTLTGTGGDAVIGTFTLTPAQDGFTADKGTGAVSATIINYKGAKLPETGGRGTTLIYLFGTLFTFATGVILISRRRMNINK